ncbi:MAG: tyrosine-type recombinase/integrase [Marivivens sp.]|nr:tyrosine-type recombinase/integrase [Marivivens sp.]
MITPDVLVGTLNPWTGKPFGREIKLGLNTRSHAEAIRLRDVRLGQIRQLESEALASLNKKNVGKIIDLSPENARFWREERALTNDTTSLEVLDSYLSDKLNEADQAGFEAEATAFYKIVRGGLHLEEALELYLEERSEGNPHGFAPLARTTTLDLRTSIKYLVAFLGTEAPLLSDVNKNNAFKFRTEYLPVTIGLRQGTVKKHLTLLRGLWAWAIADKHFLKNRRGGPAINPWIVDTTGTPKQKRLARGDEDVRTAFTSEQVSLLLSDCPGHGTRQGDLLRLLLVTGCRVDEIGSLLLDNVEEDASRFRIVHGKTDNAIRTIPIVEAAQDLLLKRLQQAEILQLDIPQNQRRLFPEWPLKPQTGKVNSASQWFTRYRRNILGKSTDGKLTLHSFRHTWRTIARRAGVAEDRIYELGGWEGEKNTSWRYDHGLAIEQLTEVQRQIWNALRNGGYLEEF